MKSNDDRCWCVYIHTNLINNKKYVGKTSKRPEERWVAGKGYVGNRHFYNAIQKYGWDNFKHEIIKENLTRKESSDLEIELIAKYNTTNQKFGYNITKGGEGMLGWHHTEHSLARIRESNHTRTISEETKKKHSKNMREYLKTHENVFKGKHHSQETRDTISKLNKEKWQEPEYRKRMEEIYQDPERNKKLSKMQKELWSNPEYRERRYKQMHDPEYIENLRKRLTGRKYTEEELRKMSEKAKGCNNAMYGKHGEENPNSKRVCQYSREGKFIKSFGCVKDAAIETGTNQTGIGACCNGKVKHANNFIWRWDTGSTSDIEIDPNYFQRKSKEKKILCINTGEIYNSVNEAAAKNDVSISSISSVCHGVRDNIKGLKFKFVK